MKYIRILAVLLIVLASCEDAILDKTPLDSYSDPVVWSDINLAKAYLARAYDQVEYGMDKGEMLGAMTDELVTARGFTGRPWNQAQITADRLGSNRGHLNWGHFGNIRRINAFLQNVEDVPSGYEGSEKASIEEQVALLKGEGLFLRAWEYHAIMRSHGGLPLMDKPLSLNEDFLEIKRATFEETINFIVADCDQAAALLNLKSGMEMGRATKEAAMALKARVLIFAASELTAGPKVANDLVGYTNPNRTELWTKAKNATKAVMDLGTVKLADFGAPDQKAVAQNYFAFFKTRDLSDDEIIWGRMFRLDVGARHRVNLRNGPNGINNFGRNGPMVQAVDSYQMMDGSDFFDHFDIVPDTDFGTYVNVSEKFTYENPYYYREPRFYATVLYDSAVWQPRFSNLAERDPIGIYDRRTRIVIENGVVVSDVKGIDTRSGPIENWNGNYGGYILKKFMDDEIVGRDGYNPTSWIFMRYAEILLNYAEACLELGEQAEASKYINMIRNRAGLPDFTGDIWAAYHYERKIELFGEDIRWYDIRRWRRIELDDLRPKIVMGVQIDEVKEDGVTTTTWRRVRAQPDNGYNENMYWIPIATAELRRAPLLEQNPGY
ncbi:MAG: RagB/SusD family nutrient uptake outer membrane protein [Mariniphaga sp.]|nr:RagB/SusD family nutrient uptake outer membrane protein [Mariniphaga sp.]